MLESYEATTRGVEDKSELVFRADEDDPETVEFLKSRGYWVGVGPRENGYRSLPLFFNQLLSGATGDVLMCGNDDMVFVTPGWAPKLLATADLFVDGVFDLGVRTHNETHFPFACVSRRVADQIGFLFDPRIFWGDIYLRDVMAHFGRCVYVPDVQIDHEWMGHAPDPTFLEGEKARRDSHMQYHAIAVDEAVQKVRELLQ
jgi:hypothetical protein